MMSATGRCPVILQMEVSECGAAALAMVLARHGRHLPLEAVREITGTSRDGVNANQILEAARQLGLAAKALRCEPEDLAGYPKPMILHWNFDHFVVLERVRRGRFHLVDPACGRRVVDRTTIGRSFTGIALLFEPGPGFKRMGNAPSVLRTLMREGRQSPDAMALTALLGIVATLPSLALAGLTGLFVNHVATASRPGWTAALLAGFLAIAVVQAALALLSSTIAAAFQAKIATHVGARGYWHALRLPLAFFQQRSAGDVVVRLRLGSELGGAVAGPLAGLVPLLVALTIYLGVIAVFSPLIAAIAAAVGTANCVALIVLGDRMAEANRRQQAAESAAAAAGAAGFLAFAAYRRQGREALLRERLISAENDALDAEQRMGWLTSLASLGPQASSLLLQSVGLLLAAAMVMRGELTLGALVSLQTLTGFLAAPFAGLAQSVTALQSCAGAIERVDDLLGHPVDTALADDCPRALPETPAGHLVLADIGCTLGDQPALFDGVNLDIAPGEIVGLTGPSGSGKSTLARIAAGLVATDRGTVTLDGIPVADWPPERLRAVLHYVPQTAAIFSGSIERNLTLGDDSIDAARLATAIRDAGLDEALARLPAGLNTLLSPGRSLLSGGELQRLVVARALARAPRLLILDETTSALDTLGERMIMDRLRAGGVAVLIVTHRAGTAARCDRVYDLASGRLREDDTHRRSASAKGEAA
jgi:ABC-type bacteriocin/lantibiotic exporter with double-glycine peptidase domain